MVANLARLPQVPPVVCGLNPEGHAEVELEQARYRRRYLDSLQVEALRIRDHFLQARVGGLPLRKYFLDGSLRCRMKLLRSTESILDGRLHDAEHVSRQPAIGIRTLAQHPVGPTLADAFLENRNVQPVGDVEVIDALGNGPSPGAWRPIELVIVEPVHQPVAFLPHHADLVQDTFDFSVNSAVIRAGGKRHETSILPDRAGP